MECNCNCDNKDNGCCVLPAEPKIHHVFGNVLRIGIPLKLRTLTKEDDVIEAADTDFIPSSDYPVKVVFSRGKTTYSLDATMDGNVALAEDKRKIPVGTYDITVECRDEAGQPYRFKQETVLHVADRTAEAGIDEDIDDEATVWYLDAAIFLTTTNIGSLDTIIDAKVAELVGDADYDPIDKEIKLYNKGRTQVIATIPTTPFENDGMVDNVYIDVDRRVLVVVLNKDGGNRIFTVPFYLIFDQYFTQTEATRMRNELDIEIAGKMERDEFTADGGQKIKYEKQPTIVLDYIVGVGTTPSVSGDAIYGDDNGNIIEKRVVDEESTIVKDRGSSSGIAVIDKRTDTWYRWTGSQWQQIGGGSLDEEVDPVFTASPAADITSQDISDWNTALHRRQLTMTMGSGGVCSFVDEDNESLTDNEVIAMLSDMNTDVHIKYGNWQYSMTAWGVDNWIYLAANTGETTKFFTLEVNDGGHVVLNDSGTSSPPDVPTNTSDLYNDSGYITTSDLATVATTGSYDDLLDKPTIPEATDLTGYATEQYVTTAISNLVNSAPSALDTLDELAAALGDDANFATTVTNALAGKQATLVKGTNLDATPTNGSDNPVTSDGVYDALDNKVDKNGTDSLMTADEHTKLSGIATGAEVNVQSDWNQANTSADDYIKNKPTNVSSFNNDAGYLTSFTETDPVFSASAAAGITTSDISNWDGKTSNVGTVTGVKMNSGNAISPDANGVVDLGTVITSHQSLSGYVPTSRKVNDKALSSDITLSASDVGALPSSTSIPSKTSDLTNDSGFINKVFYWGTSSTSASAMPKVCTVETFPTTTATVSNETVTHAAQHTLIAVKFSASDTNTTASPTLNVNSIGAKSIVYNGSVVTDTAKNTTIAGTKNCTHYYFYDNAADSGNGAWVYMAKSVDTNTTYTPHALGFGYGTQSNESESATITATLSSYALTTNGIVAVKFAFDVPANATLNINGKGAKAIYNKGAAITANVIKAGDIATFVYSSYYHLIAVDSWQDKQDAISDLETIRSGAEAGATAIQSSDLATVATTGAYSDLSGTPTIPTKVSDLQNDAGYTTNTGTLTGVTFNGTSATVSSGVAAITATIPTVDTSITSGSTNAAQSGAVYTALAGKQATLVSGTNIKTVNNESLLGSGNLTIQGEKGDKGDTGNVQVTGNGNVLIINDLTSGGTGAALSAEMGKQLYDALVTGTGIGSGTFASAYDIARVHPSLSFAWFLTGEDDDGYPVNKPIWHIGNKKFVDSIGAEVNGVKNGVTITCNAACDVKIGNTTFQLSAGENNLSFTEIGTDTSDVFIFYDSGTETETKNKVTGIDFGGFKLILNWSSSNSVLRSQTKLEFIKRLYFDVVNGNYQICVGLSSCKYIQFGGVSRNNTLQTNFIGFKTYGDNIMKTEVFDLRGFNVNAKNIGIGDGITTTKEVDIRDLDTTNTTNLKLPSSSVLEKLVIGNLTNENLSGKIGLGCTDAVLICTTAVPPKLKNCTFDNDVAQDEYSDTTDWVAGHFSAIYVPTAAVDTYKADTYVDNGTVGVTGWSKYASIIQDIAEYDG